ncbi:YgaB family protein [Neobacillus mesonae]|uniref:YgaB family protein n=1 Tax=Neobacillus mesonae TaxID=1193713 RepID=UPI0020409C4B|nr:YgaB family protein [Neobacillus mesonae]MCM3569429.1 hypothetical protein [Neobacillus mesonae]
MNDFNRLVSEQMATMEKLLFLQAELERCQDIQAELLALQDKTDLESIQIEIQQMKKELKEIQNIFEKQTEEVINSYREMDLTPS